MCKSCDYSFTVARLKKGIEPDIIRLCLKLYLEGLVFSFIGRLVSVSHVRVINWMEKYAQQIGVLKSPKLPHKATAVELDELHSYLELKKLIIGLHCF